MKYLYFLLVSFLLSSCSVLTEKHETANVIDYGHYKQKGKSCVISSIYRLSNKEIPYENLLKLAPKSEEEGIRSELVIERFNKADLGWEIKRLQYEPRYKWHEILHDKSILYKANKTINRRDPEYFKFKNHIKREIDAGRGILYLCITGVFTDIYFQKKPHMRIIVGYDEINDRIIYTDTYGWTATNISAPSYNVFLASRQLYSMKKVEK